MSDSSDPWTAAYQASPSMGFSRQKYWSGVPLPSPHFYLCAFNLDNIVPDLPIILLPGFCKAILSLRMSQFFASGGQSIGVSASVSISDNDMKDNNIVLQLSSERAMATHSSTFAWKIPWTEEPGRLQSMGR